MFSAVPSAPEAASGRGRLREGCQSRFQLLSSLQFPLASLQFTLFSSEQAFQGTASVRPLLGALNQGLFICPVLSTLKPGHHQTEVPAASAAPLFRPPPIYPLPSCLLSHCLLSQQNVTAFFLWKEKKRFSGIPLYIFSFIPNVKPSKKAEQTLNIYCS